MKKDSNKNKILIDKSILNIFQLFAYNSIKHKIYTDYQSDEDKILSNDSICSIVIKQILKTNEYSRNFAFKVYNYSKYKDFLKYCKNIQSLIYKSYSEETIDKIDFAYCNIILLALININNPNKNYKENISEIGLENTLIEGLKISNLYYLAEIDRIII